MDDLLHIVLVDLQQRAVALQADLHPPLGQTARLRLQQGGYTGRDQPLLTLRFTYDTQHLRRQTQQEQGASWEEQEAPRMNHRRAIGVNV